MECGAVSRVFVVAIAVVAVAVLAVTRIERIPLRQHAQMSHAETVEKSQGLFSYTDTDGNLHFVDDLEKVPQEYRSAAQKRDDLPTLGRVPAAPDRPNTGGFVQRATVQILVAEWCGYCQRLEQFLKKSGVRYEKLDVEQSSKGRNLYKKHGSGGIPVTLVDGEVISGFRPDAIMSAIRARSNTANAT